MTNIVLLNNVEHQNLKVITTRGQDYGDNDMCVPTFPREFRSLQAQYPIVFGKNSESGEYTPLALLGLQENENLFIENGQWNARYIPLCADCKPFYIGQQTQRDLTAETSCVIHVDLDSPKISEHSGLSLFKELGGNSDFLMRMSQTLGLIQEGIVEVKPFIHFLLELELLEPFSAEITLKNNQQYTLQGFYTINEEKLASLPTDALEKFHQSGFLFDIYMQIASLSQIAALIERKNNQL
jgi:hypothetical protein